MALTQISSNGIKDSEVKNADMADDAIGIAELSATGTASSSTFLRGDNSWQAISTTPEGTAVLSTGETGTTKFLRVDGDNSCSWQVPPDTNTQLAFANDANNRVVTGDGSGGLNGEANLTYDGDTLQVTETGGDSADGSRLDLKFGNNNTTDVISSITFSNTVGEAARIQGETSGANNSGVITFHTDNAGTSAERMRIRQDGHVEIKDGNLTIETAGHGINFHPHGGSNENLLDDYEEGTFDPTAYGESTAGTSSYVQQEGYYTKIGRLVTVTVNIYNNSNGSGTMRIGGMPFTCVGEATGSFQCNDMQNSMPSDVAFFTSIIQDGETSVHFRGTKSNGGSVYYLELQQMQYLRFTITYQAAT